MQIQYNSFAMGHDISRYLCRLSDAGESLSESLGRKFSAYDLRQSLVSIRHAANGAACVAVWNEAWDKTLERFTAGYLN